MKFEEKFDKKFKELFESHDVVEMSSEQYAKGAEALAQEPSKGTIRSKLNKAWYGGRPNGQRMPELTKKKSRLKGVDGMKC